MKYTVREFANLFRTRIGDTTGDIPDEFVISILNSSFNELPLVPKLDRLFSAHETFQLDAKDHYRWNLNGGFRSIMNIPMLQFWSSTGGDPCKLKLCHKNCVDFYEKHGVIGIKQPGTPCEYTLERTGDDTFLVLDRPSDIPIIVDYIAFGVPKPVKSMDDEISVDISSIAENLILDVMAAAYYHEAEDFAFAADINTYLDNKKVAEAIQALYRTWNSEEPVILGA